MSGKERVRKRITDEDFLDLRKHAKPLDPNTNYYPWKKLIVWNRKTQAKYVIKAESPTALSVGSILLFMAIASMIPQDASAGLGLFGLFLFIMLILPPAVEWGEKIMLANRVMHKLVAHLEIRHVGLEKTFEIRDEIVHWQQLPYKSDPNAKSSAARNRAGIKLYFRHPWQIGAPGNAHIFKRMIIYGSSKYTRSLDTLFPHQKVKTDIFGVEMEVGAYKGSLKVNEDVWNESADLFVGASWATRENGSQIEMYEPFLVVTNKAKKEKRIDCPHCSMRLSFDELENADAFTSKEHKAQKFQATIRADYEEDLKNQLLSKDFQKKSEQDFIDTYYPKWYKKLALPKWSLSQWAIVGTLGVGVCLLIFPELRLALKNAWASVGGSGGEGA